MTFNDTQFETLAAWEEHFGTAVRSDWARNPGRTALRQIYGIFTQATGDTRRFSDNCSNCIVNLLRDCGRLYFADKAEREKAGNDSQTRKVEASGTTARSRRKVAVKAKQSGKTGA